MTQIEFSERDLLVSFPYRGSDPTVVDVGAHVGSFSRPFFKLGWRVIAFEPEPQNRAAFQRSLGSSPRVTCIPKAVSDQTGQLVPFYVSDKHFGIHSLRPFDATHRQSADVETVRLDDALRELDVPSVNVLKVDIEGADFLALRGFDFTKYRPELAMIEFMDSRSVPNFGYTHHDVASFMAERDYVTYVSEWAAIEHYAIAGQPGEQHTWLQCSRYPLDHESAWGNLIFVPRESVEVFERCLQSYLARAKRYRVVWSALRRIQRVPWIHKLYKQITRR